MHGFANAHAQLAVELMNQTKNIQLPGIQKYDDASQPNEDDYTDLLGGMLNEPARNKKV